MLKRRPLFTKRFPQSDLKRAIPSREQVEVAEALRIACFVPYSTSAPGVRSRILPLLIELARRGHQIVLVSPYHSQVVVDGSTNNATDSNGLGRDALKLRCGPMELLTSLFEWVKRVDAVYIFKQCLGSAQYGWALASMWHAPILLDIDDYVSSSSYIEKLFLKDAVIRLLPKRANEIVVASRELLNLYGGSFGREKIHYIPNTANLNLFSPLPARKANPTPVFAWPGDLNSFDVCELIVRAFASMKNEAELIIMGDGRARLAMQKLAAELEVDHKIRFLGPVSHLKVPSILAGVDAGLLPLLDTLHDRCKCPIKLYEYMAMELPVVSVDFGEAAHVIREVGCGITSKIDPNSFAGAMDQVVEDLGVWSKLGKRGRQYLVANQNWELLAAKFEQILTSMMGG